MKPVVHLPRKKALFLQPKLGKKLDEMVKQGIIVPLDEQTDWVNSFVVREKPNGILGICLDPKDLKKATKREHYPVPTVDMVTNRLQDVTFFLIQMASEQIGMLDEESSKLTIFNTHNGKFRYKKML